MKNLDLAQLCQQVIALAEQGVDFIAKESLTFDSSKIEHKSPIDMVSYVDKETEKMLVAGLQKILPEAGFITEEGTVAQATEGLKWVIDPLDGTTNFMHNLAPFSVCIALMDEDEVLLGVVYEVRLRECFYAWKNGGAWCNGKPIKVSSAKRIADSLLVVGFPYKMENYKVPYFEIIKALVGSSHGVRRLGSAAADLAYVACGRLEAYFEFNIHIWDMAAGLIILEEAGGKVTDFNNSHQHRMGKRLLATCGGVHEEMLTLIQQHWKEDIVM